MLSRSGKSITATLQALALFLMVAMGAAGRVVDNTEAGTVITNRAEATYNDITGAAYTAVSETVTVTILPVAAVTVTPDQTVSSEDVGPHEQISRVFRICNTGNNPDTFTPIRFEVTAPATVAGLYFDNDESGGVSGGDVQIQLDQTASPQLQPHGCVPVIALINTNDFAAQTTLT